ncbi:FAD-dependent oxidoreductase [bacterium]|nr:FAD-dependent oxidoreductase [bacterium]
MNRRSFVLKNGKIVLGTLLLPAVLSSCSKEILYEDLNYNGKVVIIGAGVAGLYAGYLLKKKGIDFTILEASNEIGGRMGKKEDFAEFPVDTGAQWLHGDVSILGDLVKTTNTEIFLDESDTIFWHQGMLKNELPSELQGILDNVEDGSEDISFEDYFFQSGGTPEDVSLITSVAGDVGASPDKISVKWESEGYNLISYGSDDHKFEKTFFDLINDEIISKVADNIQLNTVVAAIDYQSDKIEVKDNQGEIYEADKVIITVPITVLKDNDIVFSPELPALKTQSFQQLGMEAGIKAFMRFSSKFAEANISGGSVCAAYSVENYNRGSNDLVLMGFAMGDQAKALSDMGEPAALAAMLSELDAMFDGQASASYVSHYFKDWYKEPFIRGAYSYPLVGSNENTRKNIAESLDDKLFFAGEATNYNGHHQTVHGAVESAYREVINILNSIE